METTPPQTPPIQPLEAPEPRRLTRGRTDVYAGGVAAGLAKHFGIDPVIPRIVFAVTTFVGGFGILAYVLAWIFVPAEPGVKTYEWRNGDRSGRAILVRVIGVTLVIIALVTAMGAVAAASALGGEAVIACIIIACGLLAAVGAATGRARWLIVPALVLALPAGVVAAADIDIEGGVGERDYRPATAALLADEYRLGIGDMSIDLRDTKLPAGPTTLKVRMGVGETIVLVPEGLCIEPRVEIGIGLVEVLDRTSEGLDVVIDERPVIAAGRPRLIIDAEIGVGDLKVVTGEETYFPIRQIEPLIRNGDLARACAA